MAQLTPRIETLRTLFARSGNQCAFPGCRQRLINSKNQFVDQIYHIEAASPGGQRFNPGQSEEDRRGYENLLFLCYPHHIETNYEEGFPVDKLRKVKYGHEAKFAEDLFTIDEALLYEIADQMNLFWSQMERLNQLEYSM